MHTYVLDQKEIDRLGTPVVGYGGMQSFLRRLQKSRRGNILSVSDTDFDRTCSYLQKMGLQGGWQNQIPAQLRDEALDVITCPGS